MRAWIRFALFAIVLGALWAAGIVTRPADAGKPAPPPPPLPPMRYEIHFWDVPNSGINAQINGMNNVGQAVGYYYLPDGARHAFLYDPAVDPDTAIDLHDVIALLDGGTLFPGWVAVSGVDVNDFGLVVGYLAPAGDPWDPNFRKGFIFDTASWTVSPLPDDDWSYSTPNAINENGDIAGLYRRPDGTGEPYFMPANGGPTLLLGQSKTTNSRIYLNNPSGTRSAQVAGQLATNGAPFRWTTGAGVEVIFGINSPSVEGLNDSGTICGSTSTKVGKGSSARYPYRYSASLEILSSGSLWGTSINSAGDLLNPRLSTYYIYHDSWGFLKIDDLIAASDPNAPIWFNRQRMSLAQLSDRDPLTAFGMISGSLTRADGSATQFLLTPASNP